MSEAIQLALMLGPLAVYLYVLGIWQSSRRPRVIGGQLDYALLVLGLSGIILFGPAGRVVLSLLFGPTNLIVWCLWTGFVLLWALFLGSYSGRRLVVYQTDEPTLRSAIERAVPRLPGRYVKTLRGFEDVGSRRVLSIHPHPVLRTGVVQFEGNDAESCCGMLQKELKQEFAGLAPRGPTIVTWGLFFLSWIALMSPMISLLINEPQMHSFVRQFLQRLQGRG